MKLSRDNALTIGLVALLVAAYVLVYVFARAADPVRDHSTYRYNKAGTRAFYTLLERTNVPVARHRDRLSQMPKEAGSCWIVSPTRPVDEADYDHLMAWVRDGHALVIVDTLSDEAG